MQEAGAFYGCMRCLIVGKTTLQRRIYGEYRRYLPRNHPLRTKQDGSRETRDPPRSRTHDSIVRLAERVEADPDHTPIQGVMGKCVLTLLPYFSMTTSWVFCTTMHLVKGFVGAHLLAPLLGRRFPTPPRKPDAPKAPNRQHYLNAKKKWEKRAAEHASACSLLTRVNLNDNRASKKRLRAADLQYSMIEAPRGVIKPNNKHCVSTSTSKTTFNSHELLRFTETVALHVLDTAIEDDEVRHL